MCSMSSVLCPLCAQSSFASIDALRVSLIKAANGPLGCPICQELFLGLDKLTIHLFSHTSIMTAQQQPTPPPPNQQQQQQQQQAQPNAMATTTAPLQPPPTAVVNSAGEASVSPQREKKPKKLRHHNAPSSSSAHSSQQQQRHPEEVATTPLSVCDICEFTFRNEQLRDMHFRLVHQNPNPAPEQQAMCSPSLGPATVEPENFKCHLCAKTFRMKGSLRVHLKVVHQMGLPYVNNSPKLSICDRIRHKEAKSRVGAFDAAQLLKDSPPPPLPATTASNGYTVAMPLAAGSVLGINSCGDFVTSSDANVLLVLGPPSTSAHNGELNGGYTAALEQGQAAAAVDGVGGAGKASADNPKIWECDVCAKSFTTKYFLKKHKRLHTGEMPYTCEICARTFTFQQSYHKHLLYHSNEKPHVCTICGRAFKELSTLQNHARIHSGEKPFKCEVCGKCFRQRVSYLVHARIHTGVMPYKCDVCQKSFRYKVSQRTHRCVLPLTPDQDADTGAEGGDSREDDETEATPNTMTTTTATEPTTAIGTLGEPDQDPISESFIKAFLESTSGHRADNASSSPARDTENDPLSAACDCDGSLASKTMLEKAIDDIVVESCNKMGIGNENLPAAQQHLSGYVATQHYSDGSNSPCQQLQNMRLYSPQTAAAATDAMADSAVTEFSRFLLDETSLMLPID